MVIFSKNLGEECPPGYAYAGDKPLFNPSKLLNLQLVLRPSSSTCSGFSTDCAVTILHLFSYEKTYFQRLLSFAYHMHARINVRDFAFANTKPRLFEVTSNHVSQPPALLVQTSRACT